MCSFFDFNTIFATVGTHCSEPTVQCSYVESPRSEELDDYGTKYVGGCGTKHSEIVKITEEYTDSKKDVMSGQENLSKLN